MINYKDAFTVFLGVILMGGSFVLASEINRNYKVNDFSASISFSDKKNPDVVFVENSYDFGNISLRNGDRSHIFSLRNISKENISISKIYTSSESLDAFIRIDKNEIGPFNITDYLFPFYSKKIIKKGSDFFVKLTIKPSSFGPLSIGLTQPFAVLEEVSGKKIILKTSALVFP